MGSIDDKHFNDIIMFEYIMGVCNDCNNYEKLVVYIFVIKKIVFKEIINATKFRSILIFAHSHLIISTNFMTMLLINHFAQHLLIKSLYLMFFVPGFYLYQL